MAHDPGTWKNGSDNGGCGTLIFIAFILYLIFKR